MPQPGNNLKNGAQATPWSGDEFERVPLKQRLKLLLANYRISDLDLTLKSHITSVPPCATDLQLGCSAEGHMTETVGKEERHAGEPQMSVESVDDLEHVVLKERLRRLLASKCLELTPTTLTENSVGAVRGEKQFGNQRHVVSRNQICEIDRILTSGTSRDSLGIQRNDTICSSKKSKVSAVSSLADIKIEPPGYDEFQGINVSSMGQMSFGGFLLAKTEVKTTDDAYEDELDHMLLRDRMRLLSSRDVIMDIHQSSKCMNKTVPSAFGCRPVASTPAQSFKVNRPRKRRKTVTDSVETAMEEDAPGLLKVLIDKGVSADEIKLYGEPESDDALEDSSTIDNFAELEEVITKVVGITYLGPLRHTKGEKASYSLECLLSLVEQARYLRFRNWPVEWGWCRDLQSFIFVFERHNRIVLERPEYGYATYFFELPDSLPINWQIKRLITAMKLTSCSRITIIENKALMVGDDLTEGEARVLMEYGWIPNTGLGTMLNYYDRVVHDKWNEKDRSDWRLKIAKLLTDGYNGGTVISAGIPTKVMELDVAHPVDIKLELN
ncbi:hypothetical protein OROGR_017923 [Orobanche gracilis]